MNLKIEHYEEEFEEKLKTRIKDLKQNESEQDEDSAPNNYEKVIQKLEADVRTHISVEQQLKLYVESY